MITEPLAKQSFGDMTAVWLECGGKIGFALIPADMEPLIPAHRPDRNDELAVQGIRKVWKCDFKAAGISNAIQFKISGDSYCGGFAPGESMMNSGSVQKLKFVSLDKIPDGRVLVMKDDRGLELKQTYRYADGDRFIRVQTSIANHGGMPVDLEYLASFALDQLSMFQPDDGTECYDLIRWHSNWSNEGRVEQRSIEELGMEVSWSGIGVRALRFGEQGSMPVKGFFPQAGFYDHKAGVIWGAVLDVFSSWQLELNRQTDFFTLSGGLIDREFGQWLKTLNPGETLITPEAALTCAKGNIETLQNRLITYALGPVPESEEDLPVMFNDWCTTWGAPYPQNLNPIADKLAGHNVRYFVLDDGWFKNKKAPDWPNVIGDWKLSPEYQPDGFSSFMRSLRKRGFIPGVWFEFENVQQESHFKKEQPSMVLHLDGKPIISGDRSFLDFRKPEIVDYLTEKVIRFLKDNNVGYMKVDYNAPTGFGCDGAESKPEALRLHTLAVQKFYQRIHEELPDLVLEICSSGGHRLSAAWMRQASMGSFSDAHEGVEIPIIAANTANLIPVRKNQIWAVLHQEDNERRFYYSLAAGLIGRLCISGDIAHLTGKQMSITDEAIKIYRQAVSVLKNGENHLIRKIGLSYVKPRGWQAFIRTNETQKLIVIHTFKNAPEKIAIPLEDKWILAGIFLQNETFCQTETELEINNPGDFAGMVFIFRAKK